MLSLCLSTRLQPIPLTHMDLSMQSHAQELVAGTSAFLGSLSEQIAQLCAVLDIMKSKNMDLLILNESLWPGNGLSSVRDSAILCSGFPSSHAHGVVVILSLCAKAAWDMLWNVCFNQFLSVY